MKFVCPMPPRWSDIYLALQDAWEDSGRQGEGPPVPLILNGWVFTGDFEKNHRWQQTIEWANSNGLAHLIPELKESEKYQVVEFTGYSGPVIGEQFEKPKHKPSKTELNQALKRLQEDWPVIVGAEMAAHTFPVRFTGHKKRQLVVQADPRHKPPWGAWNWFGRHGDQRAFTLFRKQINDALAPHGVDHIVFREEG